MRDYKLQPLSPNASRKPPMSNYMGSSAAAAANLGNPAGNASSGALAVLNARLRQMSELANAERSMTQSRLHGQAQLDQLNRALGADRIESAENFGMADVDAGKALMADKASDPLNRAAQGINLMATAGNFAGLMGEKLGDGAVGSALKGFSNRVGSVLPKVRYAQEMRKLESDMIEKAKKGIATKDDIENTGRMRRRYLTTLRSELMKSIENGSLPIEAITLDDILIQVGGGLDEIYADALPGDGEVD